MYGETNGHYAQAATLGSKTITVNGDYNASSDNLDGFSSVSVLVPSAGTIVTRTCTNVTEVDIPANTKVGVYYTTSGGSRGFIFPLGDKKRLDYLKIFPGYMWYYLGTTKEAIASGASGQVDCLNLTGSTVSQPFLRCSQYAEGFLKDYAYDNGYIDYDSTDGYVFDLSKLPSEGFGDLYVKNFVDNNTQNFDLMVSFSIGSAITSSNDGVLFVACNKESNIRQPVYQTSDVNSDRMIVGRIGDNGSSLIIEVRATSGTTERTYTTKYATSSLSIDTEYKLLIAYRSSTSSISVELTEASSGSRVTPTSYDSMSNVTISNVYILALEYPFIQNCGDFKFYLERCKLDKGSYYRQFAGTGYF